jgi:nucleoside-diphosphate-sugar epimerase
VTARLPLLPAKLEWLNALRVPVLMDTTAAREKLGWEPRHDAAETLAQTVRAARERGLL